MKTTKGFANIALLILCSLSFTFVACSTTGRIYWCNPNPANFEADSKLSWEKAKAELAKTGNVFCAVQYMEGMHRADMLGIGGGGFGASLAHAMKVEREKEECLRRAQEPAYNEAMAGRGWRQVSHEEAVTLGLINCK